MKLRYRIVPYGDDGWKVQSWVWWFPLWTDETQWVGYQTYEIRWFATEQNAEEYIEGRLEARDAVRNYTAKAKARKQQHASRQYPS